jgi:hypothetical protein
MQNTKSLAGKLNIKPESIVRRLSQTGSYFGIVPQKLANGRLLWPENALELLKRSEV